MGHRPRRGLGHHGRQPSRAALGDDDPVGPGALRRADHRTQIVGVGQLVAHHDQGRLPLFPGNGQDVLHRGVCPHRRHGDDPLVGVGQAHGVQLAPVGLHHHDALAPRRGGNVAQGGVGLPLGNIDFIHRCARPQSLQHRIAALDDPVGFLLPVLPIFPLFPHGLSCLSCCAIKSRYSIPQAGRKKKKESERLHRKFTAGFLVFSWGV